MVSSINSASSFSQLFSKLDTKNQGYLEKSDLVSAFSQIDSSSDNTSVDQLFTALDSDGDGKVSESEFSSTLSQLQAELDSQFNAMRMDGFQGAQGAGMGGMPPPPPPPDDEGFTKDELQSQLDEIGTSDSERSSFISNVVNNFDDADANGDGKVSFAEAQAYNSGSSSTEATSATAGKQALMPPPPPDEDNGFTLSELQSQLEEVGSSDSQRAAFISNIVSNFEAADTDGDGKVTFAEAQAYKEQSSGSADGTATTSASATTNSDTNLMKQVMQLMHAYGSFNDNDSNSSLSSLLSVSA